MTESQRTLRQEYLVKKYGDPNTWLPTMTLKTFVEMCTAPGKLYIVTTGCHVVCAKDGEILDQSGKALAHEHWSRRQRVEPALRVGG